MIQEEMMEKVFNFVKEKKIVTRQEVGEGLGVSIHFARKWLDELTISGRLERHQKTTDYREFYIYSIKGEYEQNKTEQQKNDGIPLKKTNIQEGTIEYAESDSGYLENGKD